MPNNWKTYKLGDIADIQNGYAFKATELVDSGIPVIKIKNIISPNVLIEDVSYYNGELTDNLKKYIIEKGDFLISMTGSTVNVMSSAVGKMGRYRLDDKSLINQRVGKIYLTKPDIASFEYVCQYLNRYEIHYNLALNATGSANQANISPAQIKDIEILLPTLQEQKSIASILSAIDDKIENNLAINKTLEEMAMALYKHWFVDFGPFQDGEFIESELGRIPKGWEVKSVYDIANYINGAAFKPSELVDEGKYVIKISELNGGITKNTGKSTKEVKQEQIINDGSVLFSWSATLDIFLWDKGEALLNQHIFNVLPNGSLSIETLYFLLKNIIAHFKAIAADRATTMGHIKLSHLKETFLAIPNEIHKQEFQNEIEPIFSQILENLTENQTLTQLRDTLLPKLISGEVRLKEFQES
ncbi:MAG: restriction endonuclease subunit S [Flavobacterium sp.]|nr:restriction endonuclease subunit S [Flavobacterium sp.]